MDFQSLFALKDKSRIFEQIPSCPIRPKSGKEIAKVRLGDVFGANSGQKCENDDQEDNSFLFWDVLGEDCDCVYCDDCEKGDGDENKIHPPGE